MLIDDKVISSQQGVKYVFVVKPDNTIERRNLETGTLFEELRIVKRGLKDGEKVVSTRLQILAARHAGARRIPGEEGGSSQTGRGQARRRQPAGNQSNAHAMNFAHFFIDRPIFAGVI
ncbi:MAG: hypothetical protein QM760_08575 [Nibricoccus sp.]